MESKFSLYDKNFRNKSPLISLREAEATQRQMRTTELPAISATTTSTSTTTTYTIERENKNTAVSTKEERKIESKINK